MIAAAALAVAVLVLTVGGIGCAIALTNHDDGDKAAERERHYTNYAAVYQHPRKHL